MIGLQAGPIVRAICRFSPESYGAPLHQGLASCSGRPDYRFRQVFPYPACILMTRSRSAACVALAVALLAAANPAAKGDEVGVSDDAILFGQVVHGQLVNFHRLILVKPAARTQEGRRLTLTLEKPGTSLSC